MRAVAGDSREDTHADSTECDRNGYDVEVVG